jgi:hypothetical protein
MNRVVLAVLTLLIVSGPAFAATEYLCVAEQSTGFKYDKSTKAWRQAKLNKTQRYKIRRPRLEDFLTEPMAWAVVQNNDPVARFGCKNEINYGFLDCSGPGTAQYMFNFRTMRYTSAFLYGYVNSGLPKSPDERAETPYIEIGTCSIVK